MGEDWRAPRWRRLGRAIALILLLLLLSPLPLGGAQALVVNTDKRAYGLGEVVTITAKGGEPEAYAMIQINSTGGAVVWADQAPFDLNGTLRYFLGVPMDWEGGVYHFYVRPVGGEAVWSGNFTVEAGLVEQVEAGVEDHLVDARAEANTTVTLDTLESVRVTVLRYPENPHPDVPLPNGTLPTVVDIIVDPPGAVEWPILVERSYPEPEAGGLNESRLGLYHYREGAWLRCRETGADPERDVAWARMYVDEASGSLTVVGEAPAAATFVLSDLSVTPFEVEAGDPVRVSVRVTNVGVEPGDHTVALRIDGAVQDSAAVSLGGGASTTVTYILTREVEAVYSVDVDGLKGNFTVGAPPPRADFQLSDLVVSPSELGAGEELSVEVRVVNVGDAEGSKAIEVRIDGRAVDSKTVALGTGASETLGFSLSPGGEGSHTVSVDGLSGSFRVVRGTTLPEPFPWVLVAAVAVIAGVLLYYYFSRK